MTARHDARTSDYGTASDSRLSERVYQELLERADQHATPLIRTVCQGILTGLTGVHSASVGGQHRQSQGEALEALLKHRSAIEAKFPLLLGSAMRTPMAKEQLKSHVSIKFQTLELLDDDSVQQKIDTARALQSVNSTVENDRPTLDSLISGLLGQRSVVPSLNPVRPEVVLQALQDCWQAFNVSKDAKRQWLLHSTSALGKALATAYLDLIQTLKSRGVEPVDYAIKRNPNEVDTLQHNSGSPHGGGSAGGNGFGYDAPRVPNLGHTRAASSGLTPTFAPDPGFNPDATGFFRSTGHGRRGTAGFPASGDGLTAHSTAAVGGQGGREGHVDVRNTLHATSALPQVAGPSSGSAKVSVDPPSLTLDRLRRFLNLGGASPSGQAAPRRDGIEGAHSSSAATTAGPAGAGVAFDGGSLDISIEDLFAQPILGDTYAPAEVGRSGGIGAVTAPNAVQPWSGAPNLVQNLGFGHVSAEASAATGAQLGKQLGQRVVAAMGVPAAPTEEDSLIDEALVEQIAQEALTVMLQAIMADERLLEPVRRAVLRLEPSLSRLVKTDLDFFSEDAHPARQLLDALCQRGLAHTDADNEHFKAFMQPVAGILRYIEGHADITPEVFAKAYEDAAVVWAEQDEKRERAAQAAVAALLRAERREEYAIKVARELLDLPDAEGVPEAVLEFLVGPWARVVAQAEFESVLTSPEALRYRAVISDLMWSTKTEQAGKNRNRLVRMVPPMVAALREGLATIEYSTEEQKAFFAQLMDWHQLALRPQSTPPSAVSSDSAKVALLQTQDTAWVAHEEAKHSGFLSDLPTQPPVDSNVPNVTEEQRLDTLQVGTWVEMLIQQQWRRVQLSWMSPQGKLYMFTGADGSSHSMSRRSLQHLFSSHSIRLLAQRKITERALDAVADRALSNTLAVTEPAPLLKQA